MPDKIIIDFERMKYPNTGLYHFCYHLGKSLTQLANEEELSFYVPKDAVGGFGNKAKYIEQKSLHKFWMPDLSKYDIWHAAQQGTEYFPFNSKAKKVLTIHDINFMHDPCKSASKKTKYLRGLEKKIKNSDAVVAISNFTMNDVLQHIHIPGQKRFVIYNGCNIEEIPDLQMPQCPPASKFLYTVGVIAEKKNQHVLPCLLTNNDWTLVISGITESEPYKQKIIAEAKKYGVENRVVFTGAISENDKQWYLKNCKAFVFPSVSEGFGLPVLEAMYFGKPVLLSTCTSLPEIGGETAYYFNNFDPANMNSVLEKSLQHYMLNQPMDLIKTRARTFTWDDAAKKYLSIYKYLLCKKEFSKH